MGKKYCNNCGEKLSEGVETCEKCKTTFIKETNQTKIKYKKKVVIILIIILTILAISLLIYPIANMQYDNSIKNAHSNYQKSLKNEIDWNIAYNNTYNQEKDENFVKKGYSYANENLELFNRESGALKDAALFATTDEEKQYVNYLLKLNNDVIKRQKIIVQRFELSLKIVNGEITTSEAYNQGISLVKLDNNITYDIREDVKNINIFLNTYPDFRNRLNNFNLEGNYIGEQN